MTTPRSRRSRAAMLVLFVMVVSGCGRGEGGGGLPSSIQGPPRWRVLSEESRGDFSGFALQARSACRARFRLLKPGAMPEEGNWQTLTTGQTAHVLWKIRTNAPIASEDAPSREDAEAGRSAGHPAVMSFQFAGSPLWQRRYVLWARPERGRLLTTECAPPGVYEPFDWERPIEIAALAMTDLASGEARLLPRMPQSRLVLPDGVQPGDRHEVVRVLLVVEPLSGR